MSRSIRSCVLSASLASMLLLSSCSAWPSAAPPLTSEVVLKAPEGKATAVAQQLDHRLDVAGISERSVGTEGDRVTVRFNPPRKDGADVEVREELFHAPGEFAIRPVTAVSAGDVAEGDCTKETATCTVTTEGHEVLTLGPAGVTTKDLRAVKSAQMKNEWGVQVELTKTGADAFAVLTGNAACEEDPALQRMAILRDGTLLTAPILQLECGKSLSDSMQISGNFDRDKAAQYAALLGTTLPEGVQVVSSKP